jgi:putative ABC transport system permease protein
MLKNYFKIAWRNLKRNMMFSAVNIIGLSIGLISFLLIAFYVFDELTYDGFHKKADNIYRVVENRKSVEGKERKIAGTSYQVTERGITDFPEIKQMVRFGAFGRTNISTDNNQNVFYGDYWTSSPQLLEVFDFTLLQGNYKTALTEPNTVVITENIAKKLYGTTDVINKTIKVDDTIAYKITGVLQNFPANSQLSFELLFSEKSLDAELRESFQSDWTSAEFTTYFLLGDKTSTRNVEGKLTQLVAANRKANTDKSSFLLQPLRDVHFNSADIEGNLDKAGSMTYMYIFSAIALFILLIACINYMNLTTASFTKRSKEIAVRKVAGALRHNLVAQFLSEAILTTLISLVIALVSVKFLLPSFNAFTEKKLSLGMDTDYRIWIGVAIIILIVSLLSGIYPALFQSGLKPLQLLKNKIKIGKTNISLRRSLVVFQFTLSIIMIIVTLVVYQQMKYIGNKNLGFNKEQLVVVDINSGSVRNSADLIQHEFAKLAQVKEVSVTSRVPGEWKNLRKVKVKDRQSANAEVNEMYFLGVDDQFLQTYQIELAKGRNFAAGSKADSTSVILNETAAKKMGITEAKDQLIEIPFSTTKPAFIARLVGIVKDFNFQSLHEPLAPMVLGFETSPVQRIDYFTARVEPANVGATIKQMEAILYKVDPSHLFEYHFLDKQWDLFYHDDKIKQSIFLAAAALAILIACLGLFGLATYTAQQRVKEIGVRRVLGASMQSIVTMLSKEFLLLVLFAALIAFPIGWWFTNKWLDGFAYRVAVSWWIFLLAGFMAIAIAMLTISYQAIQAAMANPVKSLKNE